MTLIKPPCIYRRLYIMQNYLMDYMNILLKIIKLILLLLLILIFLMEEMILLML